MSEQDESDAPSVAATQSMGWLAGALAVAAGALGAFLVVSATLAGIIASWRFFRWLATLVGADEGVATGAAVFAELGLIVGTIIAIVTLGPSTYDATIKAIKAGELKRHDYRTCNHCGVVFDDAAAYTRSTWGQVCPFCKRGTVRE